jgi:hypothetical protein
MTTAETDAVEREVRIRADHTNQPKESTMANYLLAYTGGSTPETDAERAAVMAAWTKWFESLGQAVVDPGNPFGPSKSVAPGGAIGDRAPSGLTGYSVIAAEGLDAAAELAEGCPVLAAGGGVEVYETLQVM